MLDTLLAVEPGRFDANRADFSPYGLTCEYWHPTSMPRPDHHSEIELNFVLSGAVSYLLGGQRQCAVAGKLCVFWGGTPHQIVDFSDVTQYIVATIPLQHFLEWRLPPHFVQSLFAGRFLSEPCDSKSASDTVFFQQWATDLAQTPRIAEQAVLLEMQARLARLALSLSSQLSAAETTPAIALNAAERMAGFISRHYTEKLTVQLIADHVGLNQYSAMSHFKRALGVTLFAYLTQHRVAHAQRMLAMTDAAITDIAFHSGFLSVSRFNDAFSRSTGCSPRQYRASIRQHR